MSEPASVCAKAIEQAYLAQMRMQVWEPKRAFVTGAGQIGLLATLMLKLRGIDVYTLATRPGPHLKSEIVEALGAHYVATKQTSLEELARQVGKPDLIFEATGNAGVCFDAMGVLAHNGVLVWTSITGGQYDVTFNGAKINLDWVLGNKLLLGSVNGNRLHFEQGIRAMSLGEHTYPGIIGKILTNPIAGFDGYGDMMRQLEDKEALKVYVNVAD